MNEWLASTLHAPKYLTMEVARQNKVQNRQIFEEIKKNKTFDFTTPILEHKGHPCQILAP